MIVGVGIDVVGIDRFTDTLRRAPRLRERLFTPAERDLPPASLAARFAAKEALAKALGAPGGLRWHDATVPRSPGEQPQLQVTGTVAALAARLGVTGLHLSMSHDAGIASAVVIAEAVAGRPVLGDAVLPGDAVLSDDAVPTDEAASSTDRRGDDGVPAADQEGS